MNLVADYESFVVSLAIWREARGESRAAKRGVYWVIKNRSDDKKRWPTDMVDVILQPWQFTSFAQKDPNVVKFPHRSDTVGWQAFVDCCDIVENPGEDPTSGANFYESYPEAQLETLRGRASWFAADKLVATIGSIRFYRS